MNEPNNDILELSNIEISIKENINKNIQINEFISELKREIKYLRDNIDRNKFDIQKLLFLEKNFWSKVELCSCQTNNSYSSFNYCNKCKWDWYILKIQKD